MGQAIDALEEVDVVWQPRGFGAHGFAVAGDRTQGGAVLEGHRQVDDAGRYLQIGDVPETQLQPQQMLDQRLLVQHAAVVAQLQRAHAGRQFFQAAQWLGLEHFHQQMHAQAQGQVQHVVAVFHEDVGVAGLAIDHARAAALGRQFGQHGG
ncbi:hypothetical protein D3C73_1309960 [compost metagenome]